MIYLTLDGVRYSEQDYPDLSGATFTLRQKTKREVLDSGGFGSRFATSFTSEITFIGEAYKHIYDKLIAPHSQPNSGVGNKVEVVVYEDCCPDEEGNAYPIFYGDIFNSSLRWCYDVCQVTASIEESLIDREARCLKEKRIYDYQVVWEDGQKFYERRHPFVWHCQEVRPKFLMDFLYAIFALIIVVIAILAFVTFGLRVLIAAVLSIVALINAIADLLGFDEVNIGNIDFNTVGDVLGIQNDIVNKIATFIHGCSKGHPSPYVRDYAINVCKACNLTFKSSILNDPNSPYYNAVYHYAPVSDGSETEISWIDDNKPLLTGENFFGEIAQMFNADFVIENGTLVFERRDKFLTQGAEYLDASQGITKDGEIVSICYTDATKKPPAFGNIKYRLDSIDWAGNEAKKDYSDLIDWNLPFGRYPQFKGEALYEIPYSPARFRGDGISRDPIAFWGDFYRVWLIVISPFLILGGISGINVTPDSRFDNALLLPVGTTINPKMLWWDKDDNKVVIVINSDGRLMFNPIFWVSDRVDSELVTSGQQTVNKTVPDGGELYQNFFFIEDPRRSPLKGVDYEIVLLRSCKRLQSVLDKSIFGKYILLPELRDPNDPSQGYLKGRIEEVEVQGGLIKIKGTL